MRVVFSAFAVLVVALLALLFQDRDAIAAAHAARRVAAPPTLAVPCATEVVQAPSPCAAGGPVVPAEQPGGPPPWVPR